MKQRRPTEIPPNATLADSASICTDDGRIEHPSVGSTRGAQFPEENHPADRKHNRKRACRGRSDADELLNVFVWTRQRRNRHGVAVCTYGADHRASERGVE